MKYLLFTLALTAALAPKAEAAPRLCSGNILNVLLYGRSFNYCPPGGRAAPERRRAPSRRRAVEWTTESCARAGGVLDESIGSCTQY